MLLNVPRVESDSNVSHRKKINQGITSNKYLSMGNIPIYSNHFQLLLPFSNSTFVFHTVLLMLLPIFPHANHINENVN